MRIISILEINLDYFKDERLWTVPLNNLAKIDPYWKVIGLFKEDIIYRPILDLLNNSPYSRIKLLRTGKTIIKKFAGYIDNPHSIDLIVLTEERMKLKISILREQRTEHLSSREATVIILFPGGDR